MSGSRKARSRNPIGIILSQTDGVDLTSRLVAEGDVEKQATFLSLFFAKQIATLAKYAAQDVSLGKCWKIIETTGDGIIFTVDISDEESKRSVFMLYLQTICEMRRVLKKDGVDIRSVSHYCKPAEVIYGSKITFDETLSSPEIHDNLEFRLELLRSELFGQDRIKLARLMSIAKGPFNILTQAFIAGLTYNPRHPDKERDKTLGEINVDLAPYKIDLEPIPLPIMRGFTNIHLLDPYLLWELKAAA